MVSGLVLSEIFEGFRGSRGFSGSRWVSGGPRGILLGGPDGDGDAGGDGNWCENDDLGQNSEWSC